jgi:hypothetical protein
LNIITYRAYSTGKFDQRTERYNHVDLFELQALHLPLDMDKVSYYRQNINETPITPIGEHEIHFIGEIEEFDFTIDVTYHITVQ